MLDADRLTATIIAELQRQGRISGNTTEDNGKLVQIDGSFSARELAEAILAIGANQTDDDDRLSALSDNFATSLREEADRVSGIALGIMRAGLMDVILATQNQFPEFGPEVIDLLEAALEAAKGRALGPLANDT